MTQKPVFQEGILTLRNLRSMGAAAAVEVLLALGLAAILIWQQVRPTVDVKQSVSDPAVQFTESQPLPQRNLPVPKQPEQTGPLHQVQAVATDVPTPTTQPVQAPQSPWAPAQQSQPPADVMNDFTRKMLRAIDDQKVYPKLQMLRGVTGETVVSFDYADGVASNIRVDKSSGSQELDAAALQAVRRAVLPAKPAELSNLDHFVLTLVFDLGR